MEPFLSGWAIPILCAAFFLAGAIDAVSGGGGLITMPAFLAVGFPAHLISSTSICSGCPGSAVALLLLTIGYQMLP